MEYLYLADNITVLDELDDNSIDSCVTDPPFGIRFMNHKWDYNIPSTDFWNKLLRILKPGAHILVMCASRTQHRMAVNIEDAGFEIRDVITWLHGQGYPKSLDISKQIDKSLGGERTVIGKRYDGVSSDSNSNIYNINNGHSTMKKEVDITLPATEEATEWNGWGTTLKPLGSFITLARKPISESTIVDNVLKWGVGGLNIDATRVEINGEIVPNNRLIDWSGFGEVKNPDYTQIINTKGRYPSNVILDEESSKLLDSQDEFTKGVSRFFYCAKPNKEERDGFNHPTMKPIRLMEYLIKLVTPQDGICIDPFMGSGTTGISCKNLGVNFIGIEKDIKYFEMAQSRLSDQ